MSDGAKNDSLYNLAYVPIDKLLDATKALCVQLRMHISLSPLYSMTDLVIYEQQRVIAAIAMAKLAGDDADLDEIAGCFRRLSWAEQDDVMNLIKKVSEDWAAGEPVFFENEAGMMELTLRNSEVGAFARLFIKLPYEKREKMAGFVERLREDRKKIQSTILQEIG